MDQLKTEGCEFVPSYDDYTTSFRRQISAANPPALTNLKTLLEFSPRRQKNGSLLRHKQGLRRACSDLRNQSRSYSDCLLGLPPPKVLRLDASVKG